MSQAAEIARGLGGKPAGKDKWTARCPAHNDKDPSLSITNVADMALFRCHAGCSQDAVIDALKRRGLWHDKREETKPEYPTPAPRSRAPMAATDPPPHPQFGQPQIRYDYYDRAGNIVGAICRWDKPGGKDVRPVTFDGTKWAWAGFPKPHPLYRMGDLLAQPTKPVLVVEGEKTADMARELVPSHVVTTWPHGASAVPHCDWSPLKGRDVVLWPDADEPGHKAMREIGALLRDVGASAIRLVKLPDGLPKGWDLADTAPDGMDVDALIAEARDIAAERVAQLGIKDGASLMARTFRPPKCAIPDLVPEGLGIIAGKPKTGKSWLVLDFALSIPAGGYALGNIKCEAGPVLYLALEDTDRRLQSRIRAVLQSEPMPAGFHYATEWKRSDEGGLEDLRAWLSVNRGARLVVIDTFQKLRGARKRDAGVYEDDYRAINDYKMLADAFTVPFLIVHHQNKAGNDDPLLSVSGTAGITGSADTILVLQREPNDPNATLYVRGRDVNEAELAIHFDNETGKWTKMGKADDFRLSEERRAIIKLLMEEGSLHPKEIGHMLGKNPNTTRFLLHKLAKSGDLKKMADGRYSL